MLYTKSDYQTADLNEVYDLVDALTLGTLVTAHEGGVAISHPIFMADRNRGDSGTLISHLAAANEHVELLRRGLPTVAVMMDMGHYIASSWYPNYPERDSAPTWGFKVVHFSGRPQMIGQKETVQHLGDLVAHMEKGRDKPWHMRELGPGGLGRRLPHIAAFEIPVERIEVKFKLGQDERPADMKAAVSHLRDEGLGALAADIVRHGNLDGK